MIEQTFKCIVCLRLLSLVAFSRAIPLQMENVVKRWVVASTEVVQEALSLCREVRKYVHHYICLFSVRCPGRLDCVEKRLRGALSSRPLLARWEPDNSHGWILQDQ